MSISIACLLLKLATTLLNGVANFHVMYIFDQFSECLSTGKQCTISYPNCVIQLLSETKS